MRKRKHKKHKSKQFLGLNKALTLSILAFSLLVFIGGMVFVAYSLGFEEAKEKQAVAIYKAKADNELLRNRLKQTLNKDEYATPEVVKKYQHSNETIAHRMKGISKVVLPEVIYPEKQPAKVVPPVGVVKYTHKGKPKPKLALILDDVSFPLEVRNVKALGLQKVNFSFFPVTHKHPQTAKLASREPFYMVHLPLEAMHFSAEEPKTLHVNDSMQKMQQRLLDIKKDFPRLRFVNNHTGSKFTSDNDAVTKLFKAARGLNLDIIDSRTIASTKLPEVYDRFDRRLLSRDVFLDHKSDVNYICGQIKLAVDTAITNGQAIAIGHPRKHTIKALRKCKSYFNKVDLVYVTEL